MLTLPSETVAALTLAGLVIDFEIEANGEAAGPEAKDWRADLTRTRQTLAMLREMLEPFVEATPPNYKRDRDSG